MMEETNDEQPEIVTHEEVALAEKEAAQTSPGGQSGDSTVPAPVPLPSFLTSPTSPSALPTLQTQSPATVTTPTRPIVTPTVSPSPVTAVSPPVRDSPARSEAPEPMQTPFEASSAIAVSGGSDDNAVSPPTPTQGPGLFGWLSNNSLVNKVVEKTKSSMESVITTLDPGMKEVIRSGGEVNIVVTSTKDVKVVPVRQAFQQTFGRATVTGKEGKATTAAQPVGFTAGLKGAEDRIHSLQREGDIGGDTTIVSIEGFIVELFPDKWYEMSCLLLKDSVNDITLQTCSQPTFIPSQYIMAAQDLTPQDYPLRWSGLSTTIGQVMEKEQPHIGRADWQKVMSGVSRQESLHMAALTLAHMYRHAMPSSLLS